MKSIKFFLFGAVAVLALAACNKEPENVEEQHDEAYYAEHATISSSDSNFTSTDDGGAVTFKTEGGQVVVNVDCGTEWGAANSAADLFSAVADVQSGTLTIGAEQNTVEEDQTGAITLYTSESRIEFAVISITQSAYGAPEITAEATEWQAPAAGALTTEIEVEASADWDVTSVSETWLTAVKSGSAVQLTAAQNLETSERTAKVELSCSDGIKTTVEYIEVTQDAAAYITLNPSELAVAGAGETVSLSVESNYDWDYSCEAEWLSIEKSGDSLSITAAENESDDAREGFITFTAGDGLENVAEAQCTVSQSVVSKPMILVYAPTSSVNTVELPLAGDDLNCTVDWGDGSDLETVTPESSIPVTHTYAEAGTYEVTIDGTVSTLNGRNLTLLNRKLLLTAVKQWGTTGLKDMTYAFYQNQSLASLPETTGNALAEVGSFYYAFYQTYKLETIPSDLFAASTKATNFSAAFYDGGLVVIPSGLFDNCPEVTDFSLVFDTTEILYIPSGLFDKCTKVTDFNRAFYLCKSLLSIPANLFANQTEVTSFQYCFYQCSKLTKVPEGLFSGCSKATDFSYVFNLSSKITTVSEKIFDGCSAAGDFTSAFASCTNLTTIPTSLFDETPNVTNFKNTFSYCSSLEGESPYTTVNGEKVHLYERANYPDYFTAPTTTTTCFQKCTLLDDYDDIPTGWK